MLSMNYIVNEKPSELNLTSEMFRDEVELYLSENYISIENYSVLDKGSIIELCIETRSNHNYYFTYNKSNGDYGVVRATKEAFEALNDYEKI